MPKQAIVLNGFAGGINKDSDATDLPAEGRGKDQVVTMQNMLADLGGKSYVSNYKFVAGGLTPNGSNANDTDDLLIFNSIHYQNKGLYKIGGDVNWSGNSALELTGVKPTQLSFGQYSADAIKVYPIFSSSGTEALFLGRGASTTTASLPAFGGTQVSDYTIHKYVASRTDWNADSRMGPDTDVWNDFQKLGECNKNVDTIDGSNDHDFIVDTTGTNAGLVVDNATTGNVEIAHGIATSGGNIATAKHYWEKNWPAYNRITVDFAISGMANSSDILEIKVLMDTYTLPQASFTINADGVYTANLLGLSTDQYGQIEFKILSSDFVDEAQIVSLTNFSYGHSVDSEVHLYDSASQKIDVNRSATQNNGVMMSANVSPKMQDESFDVSNVQYMGIDKIKNNSEDVAIVFNVGSPDGMFGTFLDINNKDVYIELSIDPGDNFNDPSDLSKVHIVFDSQPDNYYIYYNINTGESHTKEIIITRAELEAAGAWGTGNQGRIKIASDTSAHTGDLFDPKAVHAVWVIFGCESGAGSWNHSVANLYELSVTANSSLGWAHSVAQLSQTDTRNNFSSLPSNYSSTKSASASNTLTLSAFKPLTVGYEGDVYYQKMEDDDSNFTQDRFLLGHVDYAKGVKGVDADIYTDWQDSSVKSDVTGTTDGTTVITAIITTGIEVYDFASGTNIAPNTHVTAVDAAANTVSISTAASGTGTPTDLKFKKQSVDLIFDAPPLQSTFEFESGYPNGTTDINAKWVTAATNGRQVYIGNVRQPSDAVVEGTVTPLYDTDKILKAPPGKLYGFSDKSFIDLELGAGNINVLETAGDRLLVFSDDNLTIVNVAQDYEYLEASMPGYGVANQRQVAKVSEGVAFVNSAGVFFFNGNTVDNISDNALDILAWGSASSLTYDPSEKLIMAWLTADDDEVYCYSLKTKSWVTMLTNVMVTDEASPQTNSVNYQGDMYVVDTGNALVKFGADIAPRNVILETGRISCGNLAMEKAFKDIWVTTVNNTGTLNIVWSIDGGDYTTVTPIVGSGRVKVPIKSKGKDIQFKITNTAADDEFEISDMQLIYRNKRVK